MKSDCCGADIVRRYYNGEYPHARCAKCDKKLTYSNDPAEPREPERRPYRCRDCGKDMPFEEECRFNRDGTVTCYSCWGKEDHIPDATKKVEEHPGRWVVDGVWDRCIDGENYFEVTGSSLAVVRDCILQLEARAEKAEMAHAEAHGRGTLWAAAYSEEKDKREAAEKERDELRQQVREWAEKAEPRESEDYSSSNLAALVKANVELGQGVAELISENEALKAARNQTSVKQSEPRESCAHLAPGYVDNDGFGRCSQCNERYSTEWVRGTGWVSKLGCGRSDDPEVCYCSDEGCDKAKPREEHSGRWPVSGER